MALILTKCLTSMNITCWIWVKLSVPFHICGLLASSGLTAEQKGPYSSISLTIRGIQATKGLKQLMRFRPQMINILLNHFITFSSAMDDLNIRHSLQLNIDKVLCYLISINATLERKLMDIAWICQRKESKWKTASLRALVHCSSLEVLPSKRWGASLWPRKNCCFHVTEKSIENMEVIHGNFLGMVMHEFMNLIETNW